MAQTRSNVEDVIADYEALWNGDFSKIGVVAESAAVYDPAAPDGEVHGRDAIEAFLQETREAFPDFTLRTQEMLVKDETVMVEWTVTGTLKNEFYGAPPSGRSMEISGMAKTIVRDGEVQEDRLYYDQKDMLAQLGFTFPDVILLLPKLVWGKLAGGR
jgi:steroid delta-isomerase-like uncharacterized protein